MGNQNTSKRYRNYATVIYPESAKPNWLDLLTDEKIPVMISPLHDQDLNPPDPASGKAEPKKAHYHVLFAFDGVKTREQVEEIIAKIGGVGCEIVQSLRGYARYLCHLDNPEKHQYPTDQVIALGGADYVSTIGLPTDKYKAVGEMIDYCEENNVFSYAELLKYAREHRFDWFRVLCDSCTLVMKEYLKSKTWTLEQKTPKKAKIDPETGEILP